MGSDSTERASRGCESERSAVVYECGGMRVGSTSRASEYFLGVEAGVFLFIFWCGIVYLSGVGVFSWALPEKCQNSVFSWALPEIFKYF